MFFNNIFKSGFSFFTPFLLLGLFGSVGALANHSETTTAGSALSGSSSECQIVVNVRTSLNVRTGPGIGNRRCGRAYNNHPFQVTGRTGQWLHVRACGGTAYVHQVGFSAEDFRAVSQQNCSGRTQSPPPQQQTPQVTPGASNETSGLWRGNATYQALAMAEVVEHGLASLNPSDIGEYCPAYGRMNTQQRNTFWSTLLYAISIPESNMTAGTTYRESFRASCRLSSGDYVSGRVVSSGLLQVSACSCLGGYGEPIHSMQTLLNPKSNLSCGARILRKQVGAHGRIRGKYNGRWRGGSSYWSVLRNSGKNRQIKDTIRRTFPACSGSVGS